MFLLVPLKMVWFGLWCLNATFNNISVISCRSVLLMEETGVPGKNYLPIICQTLSHIVVSSTPRLDLGLNFSDDRH